jgi:hypothetical protein
MVLWELGLPDKVLRVVLLGRLRWGGQVAEAVQALSASPSRLAPMVVTGLLHQ